MTSDSFSPDQLVTDVETWVATGKPRNLLYKGKQLTEAIEWARVNIPSTDQMDFVVASIAFEEKSAFGSVIKNVFYDFHTRLTSLTGYTDLMLRGADQNDAALRAKFLNIIFRLSNNVAEWVELVGRFGGVESGTTEFWSPRESHSRLDLALQDAAERLKLVNHEDHDFVVVLPSDLPLIAIDAFRLTGLFTWLFLEMSITTFKFHADIDISSDHVLLEVTGSQSHYWNSEFGISRSDGTATDEVVGPDPRLTVVRQMLKGYGGKLDLISNDYHNLVLHLRLPVYSPSSEEQ
jgi:hypothetical protein